MTRWIHPAPIEIPASFNALGLHPLVAQTLLRRGIRQPEEAEAFLNPQKNSPVFFPGIEQAVEIILLAIRKSEKICVWGDFDVDGQTSTALLVQTLRELGANVSCYVPIRGKESHGVHIASLTPILDNGVSLVITCDTGITAHEAVDFAASRGVDFVVTDHHDLGDTLPSAKAIVNPKLLPPSHPSRNLAGVGVAYKLAEALMEKHSASDDEKKEFLHSLLDLTALGLIADVALLQGETRLLAQKGIQALRETKRPGIKAMAELAGAELDTLTEETIGFTFAPRLNALGRLSDANPAVEFLLTQDPSRAQVLAVQIEGLNTQRRMLTSQVFQAAESQLRENPAYLQAPILVLSHKGWPGGVVGIVANKLVERHHKPAILLNESDDGILRGSARSIEGLHITQAISTQKEILLGFGGHPMAAGMALKSDQLNEFRRGLGRAVEQQLGNIVFEEPALQIDAWLDLQEIGLSLAQALEVLAPFGAGNPSLMFASRNVRIKTISPIGKTKEHLRLTIEDTHGDARHVFWWGGIKEELPDSETRVDIAFSLRASSFRGQKQVTLQFKEFRLAQENPPETKKAEIRILDQRLQPYPQDNSSSSLVWAEGADRPKGRTRFELHPADEFAIYTTPPSAADLRHAISIVNPKTVRVFAVPPVEEKPDAFLHRLAGLCKFALHKKEGRTTLEELSAAMAASEMAVQLGLEWLAAGGQISVLRDENQILLINSTKEKDAYLQAEIFIALRGILEESAAYRKYFSSATDLAPLISFH